MILSDKLSGKELILSFMDEPVIIDGWSGRGSAVGLYS